MNAIKPTMSTVAIANLMMTMKRIAD